MPAYTYPRTHRIGGYGTFRRIREAGVRESRGPLVVHAAVNDLNHPRLGISIGVHVGNAARRNRIKRLLRETFRLQQHDWPAGYDLVVTVKRHEPLTLAEYQKLLSGLMVKIVKSLKPE